MRSFGLAFIAALLCALVSLPAIAQESAAPAPAATKKIPSPSEMVDERLETQKLRQKALGENELQKINPAYLAEMDQVYNICATSSLYATYYDCKCQAVKFLDQRIKLGPSLPIESLMMRINTECANIPDLAGYAYNLCTKNLSLLHYKDKDFAPFCECFANKFAKSYAREPMLSSRHVQMLQKNAYAACGFSDLPQ